MAVNLKKRAMFFSLVAILISIVFIISFDVIKEKHLEDNKISSTRTRVEIINSLVNDLDDRYFERILYVSSKAAFQSLGEYRKYGTLLPNDLLTDFKSVVFNGKINVGGADVTSPNFQCGNPPSDCLMQDFTLTNFLGDIRGLSKSFGIEADKADIDILRIFQNDPWHVEVEARLRYSFKDDSNIASWKGETIKTVRIKIDGTYGPNSAGTTGGIIPNINWIPSNCDTDSRNSYKYSFLRRLDPSIDSFKIREDEVDLIGIRPKDCLQPPSGPEECCLPS